MRTILTLTVLFGLLLTLLNWNLEGISLNATSPPQNSLSTYKPPPKPIVSSRIPPLLQAQSFLLLDNATNTVLTSFRPHLKIYPASITKLSTALTALNLYPLEEEITVQKTYTQGKTMDLQPQEKITVRSLVSALLVYSANDAAHALANHHPQGLAGFVNQMNLISQKYNFKNTNFVNVDGIHHLNHFSTVHDLAQLGRLAIQNQIVLNTVFQQQLTVTDVSDTISHQLDSTNQLLGLVPEIEGLKTGWTPEAGGCFIGLINLNGHHLISVVADSPDRFVDTQALLAWAKQNLTYRSQPQLPKSPTF